MYVNEYRNNQWFLTEMKILGQSKNPKAQQGKREITNKYSTEKTEDGLRRKIICHKLRQ